MCLFWFGFIAGKELITNCYYCCVANYFQFASLILSSNRQITQKIPNALINNKAWILPLTASRHTLMIWRLRRCQCWAVPYGCSYMMLTSALERPSRCQRKQMAEESRYINERSLLHLRYPSSWQFTSLVKTYQSFPIIFKEVACHLHRQERSFLTSSRPVERAPGDYDTLTLSGDSDMSRHRALYISTGNVFTHAHT